MLTFSASPDLMWQQRSKMDSLFHFPSSFAIFVFLFSSLLCEHEALYLISSTHTHRKTTLEFGAGIWAGEVDMEFGQTWFHTAGQWGPGAECGCSPLYPLCMEWCSKAGETLAHREGGKLKEARSNANFEKVASLQHLLHLVAHLNPFPYHMVLWKQTCNSSHICFNYLWLSSPFGIYAKGEELLWE